MPRLVQPRAFQRQVVVGDGRFGLADLLDQQEQRIVGRHQVVEPQLRQAGGRDAEELLGRVVDETEAVFRIQQHDGDRQRAQHGGGVGRHGARPADQA